MILPICILALFLMFPSQLAMTLTKWTKPVKRVKKVKRGADGLAHQTYVNVRDKLTGKEIFLSCCPYTSGCTIWKAMYQKYSWTMVASIISVVFIIFRVLVVFLTVDPLLFIISFYAFWIAVMLFHLVYAIPCAVTAYLYSMSWFTIALCFIIPYGMAWYLNNNVPRIMKQIAEEEEEANRFKGK